MTSDSIFSDPGDWNGSTFDPKTIRYFSLLPDEDKDEAYCVRHEREMTSFVPLILHQGSFYTLRNKFSCYSCEPCLRKLLHDVHQETPVNRKFPPLEALDTLSLEAFWAWDDGEAPGNWFTHLFTLDEEDSAKIPAKAWVTESHEKVRETAKTIKEDRDD